MIRVLDLFAGTQSVKKALTEKYDIKQGINNNGIGCGGTGNEDVNSPNLTTCMVEYVGIDVYSPEDKNIIIDLASDFALEMVKDRLGDGKPNVQGASPVCNKISLATAMKGGHNPYFKLNKETKTIEPGPLGAMVDGAKNYQSIIGTEKAVKEANGTLKMFENAKKIINHFDAPFAIENPSHSLTRYIMKDYVDNRCSYCMYGFPQQKNTHIFSNIELKLIKCDHKRGSHSIGVYGKAGFKKKTLIKDYADRSAVPPKLISEIISQLVNHV